jgi:hypothetical protein
MISILFHHYKQLSGCIGQVEQMEAKVKGLQKQEEEPTLDKHPLNTSTQHSHRGLIAVYLS